MGLDVGGEVSRSQIRQWRAGPLRSLVLFPKRQKGVILGGYMVMRISVF